MLATYVIGAGVMLTQIKGETRQNPPPVVIHPIRDDNRVTITPMAPPPPSPVEKYGDWEVSRFGEEGFIASTSNPAGTAVGVLCFEKCTVFFNLLKDCDDEHHIPLLISSPAGAFSADSTCMVGGEYRFLTVPLSENVIDSMEIGGELGVAFALEGGKFQVSRFSLTGALKATLRAYEVSKAGQGGGKGEQGLKDQIL